MAGPAGIEGEVDESRHHHAAEGGHCGQGGKAGIAELPAHQLPLDLQADHEKEHRHEAVLHYVREITLKVIVAHRERKVGVPEVVIGVLPRGVDPNQGGHRGDQHENTARGLDGRKMVNRAADIPS